jgi:hypothetical protein
MEVRWGRVLGLIWATLALGLMSAPALATTYWVADSGGDPGNNCQAATNQSSPKKTINDGLTCLHPGDTLIVRPGTYVEKIPAGSIPNGSSGNPTTVKSEVLHGAVLKPTSDAAIRIRESSWIVVDGFALDGGNGGWGTAYFDIGSDTFCQNIVAKNIEIRNIKADDQGVTGNFGTTNAIGGGGGANVNILLQNFLVHDIGMNCAAGNCCNECFGYAIYLSGTNITMENGEYFNISGYAVHGYPSPTNNIIRNNYFHNVGSPALLRGSSNQFYNNIVHHIGFTGRGGFGDGGYGIDMGGSNGHKIYNNTLVDNRSNCIATASNTNNAVIQNNICYQNGNNTITSGGGSGNTISNNLQGTNPQFVNAAPSAAADFQLQSGSPARDAGVSTSSLFTTDIGGNQRIQGAAQDEGAWEFGGGPT